jgi:hypothetical protein
MTNLHWVAGVALTFTLVVSACSSDDTTSPGAAGEAGAAGASESNGGGSTAGGSNAGAAGAPTTGDMGGAPDVAEGGAAGSLIGAAGAGGTSVVPVACLPAGEIAVSAAGLMYVIGTVKDPGLTLCRGNTYTFVLDASIAAPIAHPFYIKTTNTSTAVGAFTSGVTGNGNTSGNVVFTVPADAPDTLYYHCSVHAAMGGTLTIVN